MEAFQIILGFVMLGGMAVIMVQLIACDKRAEERNKALIDALIAMTEHPKKEAPTSVESYALVGAPIDQEGIPGKQPQSERMPAVLVVEEDSSEDATRVFNARLTPTEVSAGPKSGETRKAPQKPRRLPLVLPPPKKD